MGSGIEERHRRCGQWWEPHVKNTREFIRANLPQCARVSVLGAGRLIDLDASALASLSQEVHLLDADAGCREAWRAAFGSAFHEKVVPRIEDVTGCMRDWAQQVRGVRRRRALEQALNSLRAPMPRWADEPFDAIVSLNLLGQIPLYWRDFIRKRFGALSDGEEAALAASMGELQRAHMEALLGSKASAVILVTDSEYYFYEASQTDWKVQEALFGSARELLLGHPAATRPLIARDTWLWHLAPQFVEHDEEGEIHKVEALAWGTLVTVSKNRAPCDN